MSILLPLAGHTLPAAIADTHTVEWAWADGTTSSGVGTADPYLVTGTHVYTGPGVYRVEAVVTDDDGGVGTEVYEYVVVYDNALGAADDADPTTAIIGGNILVPGGAGGPPTGPGRP